MHVSNLPIEIIVDIANKVDTYSIIQFIHASKRILSVFSSPAMDYFWVSKTLEALHYSSIKEARRLIKFSNPDPILFHPKTSRLSWLNVFLVRNRICWFCFRFTSQVDGREQTTKRSIFRFDKAILESSSFPDKCGTCHASFCWDCLDKISFCCSCSDSWLNFCPRCCETVFPRCSKCKIWDCSFCLSLDTISSGHKEYICTDCNEQ